MFDTKKILGPKKFWFPKIVVPKKFWVPKILCPEKFCCYFLIKVIPLKKQFTFLCSDVF